MKRWYVFLLLIGLLVSFTGTGDARNLPEPSGYQVGRMKFDFQSSRQELIGPANEKRQVIFEVFYPAEVSKDLTPASLAAAFRPEEQLGGQMFLRSFMLDSLVQLTDIPTHTFVDAAPLRGQAWPVILFSPASGIPYATYTRLYETLVAAGYVVVALDDPYHSQVVVTNSGQVISQSAAVFGTPETRHLIEALLTEQRMYDVNDVLEFLTHLNSSGHNLAGIFDLQRIGITGHSHGGKIALLKNAYDARIKAAVGLDGFFMNGGSATLVDPVSFIQTKPLLLLFSEEMILPDGSVWADNGPSINTTLHQSTGPVQGWVFKATKHFAFSDAWFYVPSLLQGLLIGELDFMPFDEILTSSLVSFFDQHLKNQSGAFDGLQLGTRPELMPVPPVYKTDYPEFTGKPIREIKVYGGLETVPASVKTRSGLRVGQPFSTAAVKLAEERLQEYSTHTSFCIVPAEAEEGVNVLIYVQEGFSHLALTPVEPVAHALSNLLDKEITLTYYNFFGRMINVTGVWGFRNKNENTENHERALILQGALVPGLPVNSTLTLRKYDTFRDVQWGQHTGSKFSFERSAAELEMSLLLHHNTHLRSSVTYERDQLISLKTTEEPFLKGDADYLNVAVAFDALQEPKTHSGAYDHTVGAKAGVLLSAGANNQVYPFLTVEGKKAIALQPKLVLALESGLGWSDAETPFERQFVLGGTDSFSAYPLGLIGDRYLFTSSELRYFIMSDLQAAAVIDAGKVWQSGEALTFTTPLVSVGSFLRYRTPIGMTLELGYAIDPLAQQKRMVFGGTLDF